MILITGSTGYIGSHISQYFEKNKIDFIGIDNLSYSYKTNISKNQKHFFIDISNKTSLVKIIKKYNPTTILHCAAYSYVIEAEKNKKKYFLNNIKKTKKFIDICEEYNIKNFIFMSSSNVYKEKRESVFYEKDTTIPKNFYGKNKIEIENYLKRKSFTKLVILRLFNVIGIYNKNFKPFNFKKINYQRLIFKILQNIKTDNITNINYFKVSNKKKFPARDFINILDLSRILKRLLRKLSFEKNYFNIFNVGSGIATPIDKVVYSINEKYKSRIRINFINLPRKELLKTKSSNRKIGKYLKYKKYITFDKSLKSHYY